MNHTQHSTVLILGANGRFGQSCVQAFTAAGWQVLAHARCAPAQLPQGVRHIAIDMADTKALASAANNATAVIYAVNPLYTDWDAKMLPLGRQGMDIAEQLGATFLLPGNVYNFGAHMPTQLQEDSPQRPTTRKGQLRTDLEAEMLARARTGLRSVVIRAGDFFGGGAGSWIDQVILKSIPKGKLVYPGPTDVAHAWAYLPDLAQTFVVAAGRNDLLPFTRLHFAGHTLTGFELLASIERAARKLNIEPDRGFKRGTMPWGVIRIGGLVVPMWRELAKMSYLWTVPHSLNGDAMKTQLGNIPTTPIDEAILNTLIALGYADFAPQRYSRANATSTD